MSSDSQDDYLSATSESVGTTEGYVTMTINEGFDDTQVRIFCAFFVLVALASLIIGGRALHLIFRHNYNNNRPICISVTSVLIASLILGIFSSLVKLLIHITPQTFSPWCKAQQYFTDLGTNAALLSLALVVWDVNGKMQYNSDNAHWTGSDHRKRHIAVVWIIAAILAVRMPLIKDVSAAPGNTQLGCCVYRSDVAWGLIMAELIASAAILFAIALLIGAAQFYLRTNGSAPDALRMSIALLIIAVVTKAPNHIFLIVSYGSEQSASDFGIVLNALEVVMFSQGWLMPIAVVVLIRELRMDLGGCCDHQGFAQNRLTADDIRINDMDHGGRASMQSRGTKSLRSANSPMPILHI